MWVVKWVGKIDKVMFEKAKYIYIYIFASSNASAHRWGCHLEEKKKNCIKLCQMHFKWFDSND